MGSLKHKTRVVKYKSGSAFFGDENLKKPKTTNWQDHWLKMNDENGMKYGEYLEQYDTEFARCNWCDCTFIFSNSGSTSLKHHSNTKKHKLKVINNGAFINEATMSIEIADKAERNEESIDEADGKVGTLIEAVRNADLDEEGIGNEGIKKSRNCNWQDHWLNLSDENGMKYGEYLEQVDTKSARCNICDSTFTFFGSGITSLKHHSGSKKHKTGAAKDNAIVNEVFDDVNFTITPKFT